MSDLALAAGWSAVLCFGITTVVLLHRIGLSRTYARDLLHVGAGVWMVGWPFWAGWRVPVALSGAAFLVVAAVPLLKSRSPLLGRVHDSVAGEGERWAGIIAYAGAFAVLTALAIGAKLIPPAASAAGALCLGDGLGGLIGRRFGRHRFSVPWSKTKTWEGTAAVAVFSAVGVLLAHLALSIPIRWVPVLVLGIVSAAVEALAPRASDNALIPAAVFGTALLFF